MSIPFSFSLLFSLALLPTVQLSQASLPEPSEKAQDGVVKVELWCVAKNNAEDAALQTALDWACGSGGADCGPIERGGPCYDSADIQRTASFAFNDYFLKHGLTDDSCYFDNTAALTSLNPSQNSCRLPSSLTINNGSFSGSSTAVGLGPSRADLSGSGQIADGWIWTLIITHFLLLITWSIQGE